MNTGRTDNLKPLSELARIKPKPPEPPAEEKKAQPPTIKEAKVPMAEDLASLRAGEPEVADGLDTWALVDAGLPAAADPLAFAYAGVDLPPEHLIEAGKAWAPGQSPSGTENNALINEAYNELSNSFDDYLNPPGAEPPLEPLPSWVTFGQYASREVGAQIRLLESAFENLTDLQDAVQAFRDADNPVELFQAGRQLTDALGDLLSLADTELGGPALGAIYAAAGIENYGDIAQLLASGDPERIAQVVGTIVQGVEDLHQALVNGNSDIFNNIGPAYDIFMRAEANGQDGVEALRRAGYGTAAQNDEQGFVIRAFENYQQARELRVEAARLPEGDPRRERLIEESRRLVEEGNLYIGIQEQGVILQTPEIYGDPEVALLVNGQAGHLKITDPNGDFRLTEGPWADFATRTGLEEVDADTPGAIRVIDHAGEPHYYRPYPEGDPRRDGTIVEYFHQSLEPERAEQILAGSPEPIAPVRA